MLFFHCDGGSGGGGGKKIGTLTNTQFQHTSNGGWTPAFEKYHQWLLGIFTGGGVP